MYSYDGLEKILTLKKIKKSLLSTELGISSKTVAKISKGENFAILTTADIPPIIVNKIKAIQ